MRVYVCVSVCVCHKKRDTHVFFVLVFVVLPALHTV
jgi:hypothetical protein